MKDQGGMSLRDWFAGQALAGLLACGRLDELIDQSEVDETPRAICKAAYEAADAMLKVRDEK